MRPLPCVLGVLAITLVGCATKEEPSLPETQADARAIPPLLIEQTIRKMTHASRDWEMAQFRTYRQRDIDGDRIDDTILLTTFEHGNGWRQELFVCLSSTPKKIFHTNLGSKWERLAEDLEIKDQKIIISGRKYIDGDAGCCPSEPYESIFIVVDKKIVQKE